MQNQNNNSAMMSRQSGSRSGTPNSMIVLEQGRSSPTRPSSSKRSARPSPFKRGGSSLEFLPADEEDSNRSASRLSTNSVNDEGSRQTQSAGSHSRLSFHDEPQGGQLEAAGNSKRGYGEMKRSSSVDIDRMTPDSPRRQVYLPTVKRNFEQHGMPKNEELAKAVQNHSILQNGSIIPPSSSHTGTDSPHRKQQGQRLNKQETDAETSNEDAVSDDIDDRLERLTVKEAEGQRVEVTAQEAVEIDSYYVSHSSSNNATAAVTSSSPGDDDSYYVTHGQASSSAASAAVTNSSPGNDDSYYVTHGQASASAASVIVSPSVDDTVNGPAEPEVKPPAHATSSSDVAETGQDGDDGDGDGDGDSDDEEEEDNTKAPFELLGEFLEAVMEEDYENAEKLCKMVLMFEPDNAEAKQFQPLIEEMLKREREAQLWGSGSDDDEDDSDEDDSNDDDSDDEDDSDDDDDSSSSEERDSDENAEEEK